MKYSLFYIITSLLFFTQVFSQANQLQVSLSNKSNSEKALEIQFTWSSNFTPTDGLVIESTQPMMLIPVSVQINGENIWLQNLSSVPENDSVVTWQSSSNGLIFLLRNGLVQEGDVINVNCNGIINPNEETEDEVILIKDITWRAGQIEISDQSYITGNIPDVPNQEEN
jgi:hypothetical protein